MSDQERISPYNETSSTEVTRKIYQYKEYKLIQYQIL